MVVVCFSGALAVLANMTGSLMETSGLVLAGFVPAGEERSAVSPALFSLE